MTSNTALLLNDLSFNGIKAALKTYLSQQQQFNDYNFEGSNIAALIDLLAYNTQQNGYMLNMIFNELFLDTAQLYDSVASRAKELNYTPRSNRSASAVLSIKINPNDSPSYITIPAKTNFSSTIGSKTFVFSTDKDYIALSTNNYTVGNVVVFEGSYITDAYVITGNEDQVFLIENSNVDTNSVLVNVNTNGANVAYVKANTLLDYTSNSNIFFVEADYNQKYKITFGNGTIGNLPQTGSNVFISYRVSQANNANGAKDFILLNAIGAYNNVVVTTTASATGGAVRESIESIKFYAPKFFQARDRATIAQDYEVILANQFPEINSIHCYGGEEVDPPQYGSVIISVDIDSAEGLSEARKNLYYTFLKDRCSVSIKPKFVEPDFLYIKHETTIHYDVSKTPKSVNDLISLVKNKVAAFNTANLNKFHFVFRFSKFLKTIDDVDPSVLSNETKIFLERSFEPDLDISRTYTIKFLNPIQQKTLVSTSFTYNQSTCYFGDDGLGNVWIYTFVNGLKTVISTCGTINYQTGTIIINALVIEDAPLSNITLTITPEKDDIVCFNNTILSINSNNSLITVVPE